MPKLGRAWYYGELVGLWVLVPALLSLDGRRRVHVLTALLLATGYAAAVVALARVPRSALGFGGTAGLRTSLRAGAPWVAAGAGLLPLVVVALHGPEGLGRWPRPAANRVGALLLAYATVSVPAQEFLFSSFFFWRYRSLGPREWLEAVNVAVFGLAHLVYGSWLSVGLSMLGRVVLVRVYSRWGSFWGVWLLHLAFGLLAFLVGLGRYFYAPLGER
jgi:hypothetical protein